VIRRAAGGVFLRTLLQSQHHYVDVESSAERAWCDCTYPFVSPAEAQAMAKAARRNTKTRLGVTKSAAEADPARQALPVISESQHQQGETLGRRDRNQTG
jgi:hypothetical protein